MALQQQGSLSQAARCDRWILGWASSCLPLFCYLGRQKPSQHVCGKAPAQSEPHGEREEGGEEGRAVATLSLQSEQRLFLLACFPAGQTSFFKHALDLQSVSYVWAEQRTDGLRRRQPEGVCYEAVMRERQNKSDLSGECTVKCSHLTEKRLFNGCASSRLYCTVLLTKQIISGTENGALVP